MRTSTMLVLGLAAGCDIDQSVFFQLPIDGVPGVQDLGFLTPVELTTVEDLTANVIYGEVGPTGTTLPGGITFNFIGDGGSVCIFVDPEIVSWNQSVSEGDPIRNFSLPDNIYDDGDIDLSGGLSVYYTGTPGQRIGNFEVPFRDPLGNIFVQNLVECDITSDVTGTSNVHAGRAVPESCTIDNTVEGVSYTIVMQTFSVPIDDNRLGYGLLVTRGACDEFNELFGGAADERYGRECVIRGESIRPGSAQGDRAKEAGLPSPTWLGDEKPTWDLSIEAENAYCNENLRAFCSNEMDSVDIQGDSCSWEDEPTEVTGDLRRCFCGDVLDTPSGGGF
jgi:hypothetical protein